VTLGFLKNNPNIKTINTVPTEQKETSPNESSLEELSPRAPATPNPSASINGTVIGPVVTPPESKAAAINYFLRPGPGLYAPQSA